MCIQWHQCKPEGITTIPLSKTDTATSNLKVAYQGTRHLLEVPHLGQSLKA